MYRRKRSNFYQYIISLILPACLLLTACSGIGGQSGETSQEGGTQGLSDTWKSGFQDNGQNPLRDGKTSEMPYHTVGFSSLVPGADSDDSYYFAASAYSDEEVFFLMSFQTEEGWTYSLEQYDIQNENLLPSVKVFQEEGLQGYFNGLCICGEEELAARFMSEDGEGNPQEIRLFIFDREGGNVKNVLLDYAYREPVYAPGMAYSYFLSDGNYFYLVNFLESGLLVFDREGKEVRRDMPDVSGDTYYTAGCSAPDGSVIVSKVNMANRRTTLFYLQGDKENRLGELPDVNYRNVALSGDGCFYYVDGYYLIRWNISTGEKQVLLDGALAGIDPTWLAAITFSAGGRVILHSWSSTNVKELEILTCSEEEVETDGNQIVFAYVEAGMDLFYNPLVVEYSKAHPQNPVTYQTHTAVYTGDIDAYMDICDAYRTRVMADILSGGGPDIFLISSEDARNLSENGALLDLTEYLDPELREKILPSALERGVIDGKMIGVSPMISGSVMLVSNAVWEGDSWTIEDVLRLADERKPQYLFGGLDLGNTMIKNSPGGLLFRFFSEFPEKSPFVDLEAGTCNFENETFIRLLEICKEYGERPTPDEDQLYEMLKTGECLCTIVRVDDMQHFTQAMKPLEKSCHFVGYPGQEGYGYAASYEFVAVNANSKNKEAALEFLWHLFSLESQQKIEGHGASVREDVVRESVVLKDWGDGRGPLYHYDLGDGSYMNLEVKEDGSSFLEEYVTALKGLEGEDSRSEAVIDIVKSEAGAYFAGDRSAEEIAGIIQNRVQLYLDENR